MPHDDYKPALQYSDHALALQYSASLAELPSMPDNLPAALTQPVANLLAKSLQVIDYDYTKLTPHEQSCITAEQFKALTVWLMRVHP